jgi:hypothetical protein
MVAGMSGKFRMKMKDLKAILMSKWRVDSTSLIKIGVILGD